MPKPLRILHVLGGLDIGGAETLVMNLYRHTDRSKIQFDFVKHIQKPQFFEAEITRLGGRIYTCPRYRGCNHFAYKKWWKQFFKEHPEYKIIHGHVRSTAVIYLQIAKNFGLTTIAHSHNTQNTKGISAIVKAVLQFPIRFVADYYFACSKAAGEWLFGRKSIQKANFFVIPNAIDTSKFVPNPSVRRQMREQLNMQDNWVLGNVGRFATQKNQLFLLHVFAEVFRKNPSARLLLVGDGPLKARLKQTVTELGINNTVLFSDGQAPSVSYYQAMDLFVFPSLYEGLGIVLIEAQVAGLPCVISENLPQEADLQTGLITRVNLKESTNVWAQTVLAQAGKKCVSAQVAAKEKGFDITATAQWLQDFYLKRVTK